MITDAEAAQRTRELVELMPIEWRGDSIKASDLGELRRREDCQELLKEITRAVPLRLLLDHEPGSLVASEKAQLTAPYFFLSKPVKKIGSFVSHRWAADPRQTALALMAHAKLGFLLKVVIPVMYGLYFLLLLTFPPLAVFTLPLVWNFVPYAVLTTRSPLVLRMLPNAGYGKPFFWFDKSTVHQKQNCLTQAGLNLFDYYLKRTGHLTILFTEEYLTQVWCVYELAWWVSHNPKGKIVFVPLRANAMLYGLLLNTMPLVITFLLFCMGMLAVMALFWSNLFQDDRQFQNDFMIGFFVVPFLGCVIAVVYLFLTTVLVPAREERFKAAEQLRSFDVRKTQAFNPADKQWVQGQICEWWSGKGGAGQGEDAALDAFNQHVRTKVARRLASLQRRVEREIVVGTLVSCALTTGFFVICFFLLFERIRPLGWPNAREDSAKWVAPASCTPKLCNATKGPGHHSIYTDVECLDGEVVDKSETNCFGPWSFTSGTLASLMCLVLLGCIICSCTFARRWGQRASAGGSARINPAL